jgi:hypothetical protein
MRILHHILQLAIKCQRRSELEGVETFFSGFDRKISLPHILPPFSNLSRGAPVNSWGYWYQVRRLRMMIRRHAMLVERR